MVAPAEPKPAVAFVGLGVMGYPMAGHLARAGYPVSVYNRNPSRALAWCEAFSGRRAATPAEAAAGADFVMSCVGNDDDVRAVLEGPQGVLAGIGAGAVVIDHTTTSASLAEELADACGRRGVGFLDAPVSGGEAGAQRGQLSIMVGGPAALVERARPVLSSYGRTITRVGEAGFGQRCKMVNQICIAGILQGLAEGLQLALASGLDIDAVVEVVGGGAAQSWQLDNRARTMARGEFDFGFAIDWMIKDLGICLAEAARLHIDLPLTRLVESYYEELQTRGLGRCDTSALIRRLRG